MNFATLKERLRAWVVAASAIDDAAVVWTHETVGLGLPEPYITMKVRSLRQRGQARQSTTTRTGTGIPAGQEIAVTAETSNELLLTLQCWGEDPTGILQRVRVQTALPSVRATLRAGGIGIGELRPILELGGVSGPRAAMDVVTFVPDTVTEYEGYLATVAITDNTTDPADTFEATADGVGA